MATEKTAPAKKTAKKGNDTDEPEVSEEQRLADEAVGQQVRGY